MSKDMQKIKEVLIKNKLLTMKKVDEYKSEVEKAKRLERECDDVYTKFKILKKEYATAEKEIVIFFTKYMTLANKNELKNALKSDIINVEIKYSEIRRGIEAWPSNESWQDTAEYDNFQEEYWPLYKFIVSCGFPEVEIDEWIKTHKYNRFDEFPFTLYQK